MKRVDFRRVFVIAGLVSLVIVYSVLWVRMITTPAERTGADFIHFYSAGIVAQDWDTARVYDLGLQQSVEQKQVGFVLAPGQVLPFNHVPFLIPVLSVIVNGDYVSSFIRWTVLMLIFYGTGIGIIAWWFYIKKYNTRTILIICAGALTFFPLFVSLVEGQDTAILFLGACLWLVGLLLGRDGLAGSGLALMTVRPQIAVLLAIPLLIKKPKAFGWFCLGVGVLSIFSLIILGVDGVRSFLNILFITARGEWYGTNQSAMVNFIGLLLRLAPGLSVESVRGLGWAVYGLTLIGFCLLCIRGREIDEMHIALTVTLAMFSLPHLHYHDLTLLLVPLFALMLVLVRDGYLHSVNASLVPLAVSLTLLFGSLIPVLHYNLPYFIMALIILLLWIPEKIIHKPVLAG